MSLLLLGFMLSEETEETRQLLTKLDKIRRSPGGVGVRFFTSHQLSTVGISGLLGLSGLFHVCYLIQQIFKCRTLFFSAAFNAF